MNETEKQEITALLEELDLIDKRMIEVGRRLMQPGDNMWFVDMLSIAVIKRSISLVSGFVTLMRADNFLAAAHLVRLYLDNYLRFSALWLAPESETLAHDIFKGKRVDQVKDREGNLMRDSYLVKMLSEEFPWIKSVYDETSGFVHLSNKHIFDSTKHLDHETRTLTFIIGKTDNFVRYEKQKEGIDVMRAITDLIVNRLEGWAETKENKPRKN